MAAQICLLLDNTALNEAESRSPCGQRVSADDRAAPEFLAGHRPGRRAITYGTAAILLTLGILLIAAPDAIPGLTVPGDAAMGPMDEHGPRSHVISLQQSAYPCRITA